jgi:hypothetical protein
MIQVKNVDEREIIVNNSLQLNEIQDVIHTHTHTHTHIYIYLRCHTLNNLMEEHFQPDLLTLWDGPMSFRATKHNSILYYTESSDCCCNFETVVASGPDAGTRRLNVAVQRRNAARVLGAVMTSIGLDKYFIPERYTWDSYASIASRCWQHRRTPVELAAPMAMEVDLIILI